MKRLTFEKFQRSEEVLILKTMHGHVLYCMLRVMQDVVYHGVRSGCVVISVAAAAAVVVLVVVPLLVLVLVLVPMWMSWSWRSSEEEEP